MILSARKLFIALIAGFGLNAVASADDIHLVQPFTYAATYIGNNVGSAHEICESIAKYQGPSFTYLGVYTLGGPDANAGIAQLGCKFRVVTPYNTYITDPQSSSGYVYCKSPNQVDSALPPGLIYPNRPEGCYASGVILPGSGN